MPNGKITKKPMLNNTGAKLLDKNPFNGGVAKAVKPTIKTTIPMAKMM